MDDIFFHRINEEPMKKYIFSIGTDNKEFKGDLLFMNDNSFAIFLQPSTQLSNTINSALLKVDSNYFFGYKIQPEKGKEILSRLSDFIIEQPIEKETKTTERKEQEEKKKIKRSKRIIKIEESQDINLIIKLNKEKVPQEIYSNLKFYFKRGDKKYFFTVFQCIITIF